MDSAGNKNLNQKIDFYFFDRLQKFKTGLFEKQKILNNSGLNHFNMFCMK